MEWGIDPEIFTIPFFGRGVRWYGLLFALGFLMGFRFFQGVYRKEGKPEADLDSLLFYVIAGTIIGARLGHCLFYEPAIYLRDPIKILYVWEGGLASHGGTLGNIIAVFIYTRYHKDQPFMWIADRFAVPVALAGCFIRIGNFFNSEIVGKPTDLPWGIYFSRIDAQPVFRHPSMLYEAAWYLMTYFVTRSLYKKYGADTPSGLIIGVFAVLYFTGRFVIEFTKENQVAFESQLPLNMGQLLSIPFVILGGYLIYLAKKSQTASSNG